MSKKPHMGSIDYWFKQPYDEGLGYLIVGESVDHPRFGGHMFRTSFVVKHEGDEIETNNSRYTLLTPYEGPELVGW